MTPMVKRKMLVNFFILGALVFIIGCQPAPKESKELKEEEFEPKGDLSDLVYNPVRNDGTIDSSFLPIITWDEVEFDYGTIYEGDIVKKDFRFRNTGTAPLLIVNATSTCGCTVPDWPKSPIPPDSTGTILVKFDSKNKEGAQNKEVTIFANTYPNKSTITIKGIVAKTK